jgi:hypothetical protein
MSILLKYYNLKGLHIFISIVLFNLLLIWLSNTLLINEIVFYNAFSNQLTYDRSIALFENMNRYSWIGYLITPVMLLLKYTFVSLVIYSGAVVYNVHNKISLGSIFKIVIASDFVFIIAGILKFLWFVFLAGNYDFNDLSFFYPLSLINLFKKSEVGKMWIYPMQLVNVFQVLYVLSISFGLNKICSLEKSSSEKIVMVSYLPALILWIALIMFLTIDLTQ